MTVVHHELFVSDITIEHIHQNRLFFSEHSSNWFGKHQPVGHQLGEPKILARTLSKQACWYFGWVLMVQRWYWKSPRKIWGLHFGNIHILWKHFLCLRFCMLLLSCCTCPKSHHNKEAQGAIPKNILITSYWQKYCFRTSYETPWSTCTVFRSSYDESSLVWCCCFCCHGESCRVAFSVSIGFGQGWSFCKSCLFVGRIGVGYLFLKFISNVLLKVLFDEFTFLQHVWLQICVSWCNFPWPFDHLFFGAQKLAGF